MTLSPLPVISYFPGKTPGWNCFSFVFPSPPCPLPVIVGAISLLVWFQYLSLINYLLYIINFSSFPLPLTRSTKMESSPYRQNQQTPQLLPSHSSQPRLLRRVVTPTHLLLHPPIYILTHYHSTEMAHHFPKLLQPVGTRAKSDHFLWNISLDFPNETFLSLSIPGCSFPDTSWVPFSGRRVMHFRPDIPRCSFQSPLWPLHTDLTFHMSRLGVTIAATSTVLTLYHLWHYPWSSKLRSEVSPTSFILRILAP